MADWTDPDGELAALWEEFENEEDYEGQIAIFQAALDAGLLDDGLPSKCWISSTKPPRPTTNAIALMRWSLCCASVCRTSTRHDAHFYLDWLISNALITGRLDTLSTLVDPLADLAGAHLDIVNRVFDQLAYYDQLPVLAAGLRRAWPSVQHTDKYFEWAVVEFSEMPWRTQPSITWSRRQNLAWTRSSALASTSTANTWRLKVRLLFWRTCTGEANRRWTLDDFDLTQRQPGKGESEPAVSQGRLDFYYLTVEFLGYLHREEGVSYAKGELARDQMQSYILRRSKGRRKVQVGEGQARRARPRHDMSQSNPILLPDHASLDRYLADLLNLSIPGRIGWRPCSR